LGARKVSPPEGDNVKALSPLFWLKKSGFHITSENRFFVCCMDMLCDGEAPVDNKVCTRGITGVGGGQKGNHGGNVFG